MRIIFLFLISFTTLAQFAPVSEVDSNSVSRVYRSQRSCPGNCMKIPVGYNKAFHRSIERLKNDLDNPIVSKNEAEVCLDDDDCQSKLEAKVCSDNLEKAIKRLDTEPKEVYCTKTTYNKIPSGEFYVVVDDSLKASYEAQRAVVKAEEDAVFDKMTDMTFGRSIYASVQILNKAKGLSKTQRRALRGNLKTMRDDLLDGSICDVREDLVALAADGVLIREQDKAAILAKIDAYKTCP